MHSLEACLFLGKLTVTSSSSVDAHWNGYCMMLIGKIFPSTPKTA